MICDGEARTTESDHMVCDPVRTNLEGTVGQDIFRAVLSSLFGVVDEVGAD